MGLTAHSDQKKYLFCECGPGRRSRTFNFGFKARRVASYTIPEKTLRCSYPLPTLTGSIDQHAVVTLHPTLYACDFAGSYSLSGVEPVTRPLASPKLRQAQFPTYPVGYGLCSPLSCRLPAASISQLTQFASSVPECACRVRDTALLIRQRASESRRR